MSLTVAQVYGVRFAEKLSLPKIVQDNIAKLRITPVVFKPFRPPPRAAYRPKENWRENALVEAVRRVKERDDPEYDEVFSSLNKIAPRTLDKLSEKITLNIKKRDEIFRLRVTTLLFDMAISQSGYAILMSDCAKKLATDIPEIQEDLVAQTEMFPKLYNMTETLTYPSSEEAGYADKVIEWMKLKDKRRGYAKFMTQLFVRDLVTEQTVGECMTHVSADLAAMAKQPKSEQTEENTTQYVDFLFETAKILPATAKSLRTLMKTFIQSVLEIPRAELPSLNMRSRFKLEDAIKCVQ
jgi:hypothetical protein